MRRAVSEILPMLLLVFGCGKDGGNEPEDPFPDVEGVYEIEGTFDDLPSSEASFEGTLELTQASQESGALGGSIAVLATIGDDIFNVSDEALSSATVSPTGVVAFTASGGAATWTFSGTVDGNSVTDGRHTLSDGSQSISGDWSGEVASSVIAPQGSPLQAGDLLRGIGQLVPTNRH